MSADALSLSRSVYERLVSSSKRAPPRMRAWDGSTWGPSDATATIVLQHPGSLRALLLPPNDLTAGEAYIYDDIDIDGDIFAALEFAADVALAGSRRKMLRTLVDVRRLPGERRRTAAGRPSIVGRLHSIGRDRQAVRYHYDRGNDFYELFLGETMAYSCAYFLDPDEPLDTAQRRKLDLVCRKLGLGDGTSLLDVGCGWGSLAIHAAVTYGANVTGVTVSGEQAEYARRRAEEMGVGDRVRILHADYREVGGRYDAIASIGMFEHVGRRKLAEYFGHLRRLLAPQGRLLNHGITTRDRAGSVRRKPTFVSTYVFPDGELEPIDLVAGVAESSGFELRDLESMRVSYARTLRHWVRNLDAHRDAAVSASDERTYRTWRLYMAGSAVAFERASIAVYQMLLTDPAAPWTFGRRPLLAADDQ
jgi:cyclopropane-fatty-acyl-phospholipid synthase